MALAGATARRGVGTGAAVSEPRLTRLFHTLLLRRSGRSIGLIVRMAAELKQLSVQEKSSITVNSTVRRSPSVYFAWNGISADQAEKLCGLVLSAAENTATASAVGEKGTRGTYPKQGELLAV